MGLPQILTDREVLGSHIQEVRKIGERARMEGTPVHPLPKRTTASLSDDWLTL